MTTHRDFSSNSPEQTIAAGRELARFLQPGQLIALRGDLGSGKTTIVKGIAEGLNAGLRESVTSPTFTLVHEYRGPSITVFHIDLYRIETERELLTVGIDDLRAEPGALLLIEWADKFPSVQQDSDAEIVLERTADRERKVTYRWHSRR